MHHDVRYAVMGSEPKLRLVTRIDRNRSSVRGGGGWFACVVQIGYVTYSSKLRRHRLGAGLVDSLGGSL